MSIILTTIRRKRRTFGNGAEDPKSDREGIIRKTDEDDDHPEGVPGKTGGRVSRIRGSGWPPGVPGSIEAERSGCRVWKYAGLFENTLHPDEETLLNWWTDQKSQIEIGKMGYRTKTTKAGKRLEVEIYPVFGRETEGRLRAAKRNLTRETQERLNLKRAQQHFVQLVDANFTEKDIHLTLTYAGEPPAYEQAKRDLSNFLRRVKRLRERRGLPELKYCGVIEGVEEMSGGYKKQRIHAHLLMNDGVGREELEAIWAKGYANADRLKPDERGLEAIARYIIKQQKHRRKWMASRNLRQPKIRTSDTKASNARVRRIAGDIRNEAKGEMEKLYKGYRFVDCEVNYSDLTDGVYIHVLMRKEENHEQKIRGNQRGLRADRKKEPGARAGRVRAEAAGSCQGNE